MGDERNLYVQLQISTVQGKNNGGVKNTKNKKRTTTKNQNENCINIY